MRPLRQYYAHHEGHDNGKNYGYGNNNDSNGSSTKPPVVVPQDTAACELDNGHTVFSKHRGGGEEEEVCSRVCNSGGTVAGTGIEHARLSDGFVPCAPATGCSVGNNLPISQGVAAFAGDSNGWGVGMEGSGARCAGQPVMLKPRRVSIELSVDGEEDEEEDDDEEEGLEWEMSPEWAEHFRNSPSVQRYRELDSLLCIRTRCFVFIIFLFGHLQSQHGSPPPRLSAVRMCLKSFFRSTVAHVNILRAIVLL